MPIFRRMRVALRQPSLLNFMSHTFPKILLSAMVGIITFSGCYQQPSPTEQAMSQLPDLTPQASGQQNPQYTASAPQPPDNALFPIVNIYGELRPAVYRATQSRPNLSFQQHTSTAEGHDADVVLDPTGRWLAFSSTRHSERADIYLQRVDGSSVIQLTNDPADDVQPCFSPDGSKIAFASSRAGTWDLYVMDIDGKNVEQLTSGLAQDLHPTFSPDSTRLAYCSLTHSGEWEIWLLNLSTHEKKCLGPGLFPSWCPRHDVDRIAFQRARQRGSRWFSIWTLDLIDGEPRRNTEIAVSSNAAVVCPAWSPDGMQLAFSTIHQPANGDEQGLPQQELWIVNADGSGRQRLAEGNTNLTPFWSTNNRIFFISDRGGQENIWSVKADAARNATATINEPLGK
jgi:TolB protein